MTFITNPNVIRRNCRNVTSHNVDLKKTFIGVYLVLYSMKTSGIHQAINIKLQEYICPRHELLST